MSRYGDDEIFMSMPTGSWNHIINKRYPNRRKMKNWDFNQTVWAMVELDNPKHPQETAIALLDLLSGHFRFLSEERIKQSKPQTTSTGVSLPGIPRLMRPRSGLINGFARGLAIAAKYPRLSIALQRWHSSLYRSYAIDAVIDCCSSLDSIFNVQQELRLRLAFAVHEYVTNNKKRAGALVYDLYGKRNEFVHGSSVPAVSDLERRNMTDLTAGVLKRVIKRGQLPRHGKVNIFGGYQGVASGGRR